MSTTFNITNINTTATNDVKLGSNVPYVRRHVVPSAVSLAGVNTRHRQSRLLTACKRCPLPRAGETGFLQISAGKASYNIMYVYSSDLAVIIVQLRCVQAEI